METLKLLLLFIVSVHLPVICGVLFLVVSGMSDLFRLFLRTGARAGFELSALERFSWLSSVGRLGTSADS